MSQITSWVDAHYHLWDLDEVHYPWLAAKGNERFFGQPDRIRKNYLLADFANDHQHKISKSVHIQVGASHSLEETALIHRLSQSSQSDNIHFPSAAVVAINMRQPSIEQQLAAHLAYDITRGVRDIIGKSFEENNIIKIIPRTNIIKPTGVTSNKPIGEKPLSSAIPLTINNVEVPITVKQPPKILAYDKGNKNFAGDCPFSLLHLFT